MVGFKKDLTQTAGLRMSWFLSDIEIAECLKTGRIVVHKQFVYQQLKWVMASFQHI